MSLDVGKADSVFCVYCGHSFGRYEHLERHILTHTNVKPFQCTTCYRSFTRRDLLKRHLTVHGPPDAAQTTAEPVRVKTACAQCANAKTKCDKKFPCSRCAVRHQPCEMRQSKRIGRPKARSSNTTPSSPDETEEKVPLTPDNELGQSTLPPTPPYNTPASSSTTNTDSLSAAQTTILPAEAGSFPTKPHLDLDMTTTFDFTQDWSMYTGLTSSLNEGGYSDLSTPFPSSLGELSQLELQNSPFNMAQAYNSSTNDTPMASIPKDATKEVTDLNAWLPDDTTTTTVERNGTKMTIVDSKYKFQVCVEVLDEAAAAQSANNIRASLNALLGQFAAGYN